MKTKKAVTERFKVSGIRLPVKASVAAKCLYDIYEKNNNKLTDKSVLNTAKNKNHPLHDYFEWNNTKAAELYRKRQARDLIRCVVVERMVGRKPISVRAFINVKEDMKGNLTHNPFNSKGQNYFVSINDAMQNDFLKAYTIESAIIEINRWMDKYKNLKRLSNLFKTIKIGIKKIKK